MTDKQLDEKQFENRIYDLAHSITEIFYPEISQGSWVFKRHKEKVIERLLKDRDLIKEITNR